MTVLVREANEMDRTWSPDGAVINCDSSNDRLGRARYLLFQPAPRRCPKNFGRCLRHFWCGGAGLVSFFGQTNSSTVGFLRRFPATRFLVVDDSPQARPRLGAGICPSTLCHNQRRSGDDSQHQKLRLPDRDRFHAALLRQDLRPPAARLSRRYRLLLDGRCNRSYFSELRIFWQRFYSDLHRDTQAATPELFHHRWLFQAVRTILRRSR